MLQLTWQEVWERRLARHYLLNRTPAPSTPEQLARIVGAVCGIQAQVMSAAELSIGIRSEGVTRQDIQAALWEERVLVKTYGLRGTIHIFPSSELSLWTAALRVRAEFERKRREQQPGSLTEKERSAILEAMADVLGDEPLTTQQLGDETVRRAGAWAGETRGEAWGGGWPLWRMALGDAALEGILCYGPPQGSQVTFVRLDRWLNDRRAGNKQASGEPDRSAPGTDSANRFDPQDALGEVFCRYLRAYGPARPRDFAQWFNVPPAAARELESDLRSKLVEVDVEGYRAYLVADDLSGVDTSSGERKPLLEQGTQEQTNLPPRLLPHFDCYVIGCHPRERLLPETWAQRVPPRTTPSQLPTLLLDGKVAGLWEKSGKGSALQIRVEPFRDLSPREREELEQEAHHIGRILGAKATLEVGPVAARPHL
jgi:hypothetical protein